MPRKDTIYSVPLDCDPGSDPDHLVAVVGCEGLVVVHTADATLVCRADKAEQIKKLQELLSKTSGQQRYT